ncbi:hypothetical protein GCM10017687_30620 [Streptomyces echinatus]
MVLIAARSTLAISVYGTCRDSSGSTCRFYPRPASAVFAVGRASRLLAWHPTDTAKSPGGRCLTGNALGWRASAGLVSPSASGPLSYHHHRPTSPDYLPRTHRPRGGSGRAGRPPRRASCPGYPVCGLGACARDRRADMSDLRSPRS